MGLISLEVVLAGLCGHLVDRWIKVLNFIPLLWSHPSTPEEQVHLVFHLLLQCFSVAKNWQQHCSAVISPQSHSLIWAIIGILQKDFHLFCCISFCSEEIYCRLFLTRKFLIREYFINVINFGLWECFYSNQNAYWHQYTNISETSIMKFTRYS